MKINDVFKSKKKLFIPFIMSGHPDVETCINAVVSLADLGADIIELGIPFSDPVADGKVNAQAAEIALKNGMNMDRYFDMVQSIRQCGCTVPFVAFTYCNPVLWFGVEKFALKLAAVEIDTVLIVDLPMREYRNYSSIFKEYGVSTVLLVGSTMDKSKLAHYNDCDELSFIYYVSRNGVTGVQASLRTGLAQELEELYSVFPDKNIVLGFGVSNLDQARSVARMCQGVVVGSALVAAIQSEGLEGLKNIAGGISDAIHGVDEKQPSI